MALGSAARPIDPLLGLYAATTRRGESNDMYAPNERLTMPEAIVGYTHNGAALTFEEHINYGFCLKVGRIRRVESDHIQQEISEITSAEKADNRHQRENHDSRSRLKCIVK